MLKYYFKTNLITKISKSYEKKIIYLFVDSTIF